MEPENSVVIPAFIRECAPRLSSAIERDPELLIDVGAVLEAVMSGVLAGARSAAEAIHEGVSE